MTEEWRSAPGFETHYEVSSFGRVRRIARAKGATPFQIVKPWPDGNGRLRVSLHRNNLPTVKAVARLIASAFLGESSLEVNHIDGDFTHNHVANLEYTTRAENTAHAVRMNLVAYGTRCAPSKLTEAKAIEARRLYANGELDQYDLAIKYGVAQSTIHHLLARHTWRRA